MLIRTVRDAYSNSSHCFFPVGRVRAVAYFAITCISFFRSTIVLPFRMYECNVIIYFTEYDFNYRVNSNI